MSTVQAPPRLPDWLVANRNFVLLWLAYGVAAIGDHLSEMALLQERGGLDRTDATRVQALITFGFFLPFVILGPIAGWWSDRFSRKTTMIVADLLRAALVFNLAIIVAWLEHWLEPSRNGDYAIVLPLAAVGALAAFFSPARQAILPTLIRDDQLVRANAMINALGTIGGITGGVLGGILVQQLGTQGLHYNYYINAATFALSALFVSGILMARSRALPHPPLEGVWKPVADGFRYVAQHRRVLGLILLGTVFWAAAGVVISVIPAIVRDVFGGSIQDVAIYRGLLIIGMAVGAAVMTLIGPSLPPRLAILAALLGGGLWVMLLDVAYTWKLGRFATGLTLFCIGGAGAALLVSIMALLQRLVPDTRRGRVFGVSDMTTMGALVLATGLLGVPRIDNLDHYIPWLLLITGGALLVAAATAWGVFRRGDPFPPLISLLREILQFYARFWLRLRRDGACTIPPRGAVILASNHTAGVDPMAILATSPHRLVSFLVAEEYYHRPIAGWFMRKAGCIPIDRKNPGKSFLVGCLRTLNAGGCLGIFPQGTFEEPGKEEPDAKSGVGLLALRSGATVVPCHISGTRYFDSPFAAYLVRHRMRIRYGPPIDLSAFAGREKDREAHEEASALIMEKIRALAPPENEPRAE